MCSYLFKLERTKSKHKGGSGRPKKVENNEENGETTEEDKDVKKKKPKTTKLLQMKLSDSDSDFNIKRK